MQNNIKNIVNKYEKEYNDNCYHLQIHLLNLVCVAKERFNDRERHDLFHACINFNRIVPKKYQIDWESYYD